MTVSMSDSGSRSLVQALVLCSWERHFSKSLNQVYKWVPGKS